MSLLHAGERKVPEIMVHKLQEALAKQLDIFGSSAVLPESGTDSVSKFCLKTTNICKNILNMQHMQKQTKYADIRADLARKKLIDCRSTSDSKLRMNRAENGPNFAHHVVKPPAINGLILTHKVSAAAAVILFHRGRAHNKTHLGCLFPARKSSVFLPVASCGGRAPSARRMWPIA